MAERAFGDAALSEPERNAATIARAGKAEITAKQGHFLINAREVTRKKLPRLREAEKVYAAFDVLVEFHWLRSVGGRAGDRRGRERGDFEINPAVMDTVNFVPKGPKGADSSDLGANGTNGLLALTRRLRISRSIWRQNSLKRGVLRR
jgi:hypothetical protein